MKRKTFKGGVHPLSHIYHGKSLTEHKAVEKLKAPKKLIIPMSRIIGKEAKPIVKIGDRVLKGQLIGEAQGFISANIHSSVSGKVIDIGQYPHPTSIEHLAVVIENDFKEEISPDVVPKDPKKMSDNEIIKAIKDGGIVGMGGATFPSHVKLAPPPDKKIDRIILNGAECEPYLTSDHRRMLESPKEIIDGLRLLMKVLDVKQGYIGIEDNKKDAVSILQSFIKPEYNIKIISLMAKYPQGAEKQLIKSITGRIVPSGGLPMDVGVVVFNVGTAAAIYRTIKTGMPSIERIVTVSGSCVKEPKNLLVRYGTPFSCCLEACGGVSDDTAKILSGGPMMGVAQSNTDAPVIAGTSGILALGQEETTIHEIGNCIRCARCIDACPLNLMPLLISASADAGRFEEAEKYNAMDCVECGACSFICPARRHLVQSIRLAKNAICSSVINKGTN